MARYRRVSLIEGEELSRMLAGGSSLRATAHRGHAGAGIAIVLLALLVSECAASMCRDDFRQETCAALRDDPQLRLRSLCR
jgi:hypothetical protein